MIRLTASFVLITRLSSASCDQSTGRSAGYYSPGGGLLDRPPAPPPGWRVFDQDRSVASPDPALVSPEPAKKCPPKTGLVARLQKVRSAQTVKRRTKKEEKADQSHSRNGNACREIVGGLAYPVRTVGLVAKRERCQDQPSSGQEDDQAGCHPAHILTYSGSYWLHL